MDPFKVFSGRMTLEVQDDEDEQEQQQQEDGANMCLLLMFLMLNISKDNIRSAGFTVSCRFLFSLRLGVDLQINAGMMKQDAGVFCSTHRKTTILNPKTWRWMEDVFFQTGDFQVRSR